MDTKVINLQKIGSQLEQSAKTIEAKVRNTDNRFNLPASALIKKVPQLKAFGGATVFQARWSDEGMKIEIPRVCKTYEGEKIIVQMPDLEPLQEIEFVRYIAGLSGFAVIKVGGIEFQIGLSTKLDLEDDELEKLEGAEGEGIPPIEILSYEKRPEIPLKSDLLPLNEELVVVGNGKKSRGYDTPMCDVRITSTGEVLKNIITNSQLERLIEEYGSNGNCKFKITKKVPHKNGKTRVSILDLNGLDFSDLEI